MGKPDYNNIPADVMRLAMANTDLKWCIPVSTTFYKQTIAKYPEWFPKEAEYRRKWNLIPEHVHASYNAAMELKMQEICGDDGLFSARWDEFEKEEKKIHKEYYSKYGI